MKLNERQLKIRNIFRNYVIDNWISPDKFYMFGIIIAVADALNETQHDAIEEMAEIPSIGRFWNKTMINAWMGKYFKPVADALWDGKSKEEVLKIWSKTKKHSDINPKINSIEKKEHAMILKSNKKLRALAELYKNKPDRYDRTAWNKCK